MRRYNLVNGAKTTAGGTVYTGYMGGTINGVGMVREGDIIVCPACSTQGDVVCVGPRLGETWDGAKAALEGDVCRCKCDPPPKLIANQFKEFQDIDVRNSSATQDDATARSPTAHFSAPSTKHDSLNACVFAKSCVSVPAGSTDAGTAPEQAENFGSVAIMASTGAAGTLGRVAGTLGSDLGTWAVRGLAGASAAANVVLLALWPRDIGDSTLYTPEQLSGMQAAITRVRFQFRQTETGEMAVYGIHTKPSNGSDRVPVAHARWNADKSAMVAVLDGRLRNGLHVDHMPSQAAIRRYLEDGSTALMDNEINDLLMQVASIAIPARVHQKFSETYGGRNTKVKQLLDAGNLREAVDSNYDAIKSYLIEEGFTEGDLEAARAGLHKINQAQGWY